VLFTQYFSRAIAAVTIFTFIVARIPANAEIDVQSNQNILEASKTAQSALANSPSNQSIELACAVCGCNELCPVAIGEATISKKKDPSLLTDSLWGNLILEMAYQRDNELKKLAKKLNIVNMGTMGAFMGVTAGTLAQGISALYVINPPAGKPDSSAPLYVGTALSGATLLTFATRLYFGNRYHKKIRAKQLAIKDQVEEILHHLEYSAAKCPEAKEKLTALIGERACGEFMQLWQSSHQQLASTTPRTISMIHSTDVSGAVTSTSIRK